MVRGNARGRKRDAAGICPNRRAGFRRAVTGPIVVFRSPHVLAAPGIERMADTNRRHRSGPSPWSASLCLDPARGCGAQIAAAAAVAATVFGDGHVVRGTAVLGWPADHPSGLANLAAGL
jgi:hypothetical protein